MHRVSDVLGFINDTIEVHRSQGDIRAAQIVTHLRDDLLQYLSDLDKDDTPTLSAPSLASVLR